MQKKGIKRKEINWKGRIGKHLTRNASHKIMNFIITPQKTIMYKANRIAQFTSSAFPTEVRKKMEKTHETINCIQFHGF